MAVYIAIDLKSFYASVECVERGLNPLKTNLVVADRSRTDKTICLAVSPSLKSIGLPGRPRLFEVVQKVKEANERRRLQARISRFEGQSDDIDLLNKNNRIAIDYIVAPPQMALYLQYSARIYSIYLRYIAPEDIHIYSIDEVFIDATSYLPLYKLSARDLAIKMIREVLEKTGVTATVGIGTNLYLAKIAMDIVAKRQEEDKDGVRVAQIDERTYREMLWEHRPITDFWRVGSGYASRLESLGLYTMGDVARASIATDTAKVNENTLYETFGVNAELLIDHAWGWEPTTIAAIQSYRPEAHSVCSGQVLQEPYNFEDARLVVDEMADELSLNLVEQDFVTGQLVLTVGYDIESLTRWEIRNRYLGPVEIDAYGRSVPKSAHGSIRLKRKTASSKLVREALLALFDRIVNPELLVRRLNVAAVEVVSEEILEAEAETKPLDLFADPEALEREEKELQREKQRQKVILQIKDRFGKNAILRGVNLEERATQRKRNLQIGGHKA